MDGMNLIDWLRGGPEETAVRGPECPDDSHLAAFVDGRLPPEDHSRLGDHLADCDHCLRVVAFVTRNAESRHLAPAPGSLVMAARERRFERAPSGSARGPWRWAAAAALVAFAAVAIWRLDPGATTERDSGFRSRPPSGLPSAMAPRAPSRGPQVVFPAAGQTISPAGVDFRWTEIPTAVSYEVRVVTLDGDLVWETRVFETEATVPAEVQLDPGGPYLVRISALLAGGKTLDSRHVRFFVRSP